VAKLSLASTKHSFLLGAFAKLQRHY